MIAAGRFEGFRAETKIDVISAIQEAQTDDDSLKTLIESTKEKGSLPVSIRRHMTNTNGRKTCYGTKGE
jgi:hypothetical protein